MFIDTNILVNARIREAPHHEVARAGLESALRGPEPLRISRQVMREYLAVVTRPQPWPVSATVFQKNFRDNRPSHQKCDETSQVFSLLKESGVEVIPSA